MKYVRSLRSDIKYVLIKPIGKGTFGTVYSAYKHDSDQKTELWLRNAATPQYAIKEVFLTDKISQEEFELSKTEINVYYNMRNEHIINLFDWWYEKQTISFVFEFADKGDLRNVIDKIKKIPKTKEDHIRNMIYDENPRYKKKYMTYFLQVCSAVKYIHT